MASRALSRNARSQRARHPRGALVPRTRYIDDAVAYANTRGLRVVVILSAGLDTRAYRLSGLTAARVFDVNLPAVQARKKAQLVRRFGALPSHLRFVPTDLNVDRLDARLAEAA
jgi:methyltransferase (TIGR00027 family)